MSASALIGTAVFSVVLTAGCGRAGYDAADAGDASDGDGGTAPSCDDTLADGLVGWWSFEGTGETVTDDSGGGNTGTVLGSASRVPGRVGSAMQFSTPDDRVQLGVDPSLGLQFPMTITAWVRPDRLVADTRHSIVGRDQESGARQFEWGVNVERNPAVTSYPECMSDGQVWSGASSTVGSDGAWTHLAVVFHPDFLVEHYINGVSAGGNVLARTTRCTAPGPTTIGGTAYGPYPWEGAIDEVRFYDRVLTRCEIEATRCDGDWHCADGAANCGETDVDTGADCP